jgi:hypothetical protein
MLYTLTYTLTWLVFLKHSQGSTNDAGAVNDFIEYNGPELDAATNEAILNAVTTLFLDYLDCLREPL